MNKRKLGSSRRGKGRRNVKETEIEQDLEAREDVEDEASNKTRQTPASAKTQKESGGENEFNTSAQYATSLASAIHSDYSEPKDSAGMSSPEHVFKIRVNKDDGMRAFENETKQEGPEKCDIAQKQKAEENVYNCPSELTSLSARPSADQQNISKQPEQSHVFSVVESERIKRDDTDLFRQDESLQGNYLVCESHVSESNMQEITADKSKVNGEINNSAEQAVFSLPKDDWTTNGDGKPFKLPEVRHDVGNENNKPTHTQHTHQNNDPPESFILNASENSDSHFGNQPELSAKASHDSAVKEKVSSPDDEQNVWSAKEESLEAVDKINTHVSDSKITWINKTEREDVTFSQSYEDRGLVTVDVHQGVLTEARRDDIFVQSPLSDLNVPDAQPQEKSLSTEEQTDASSSFSEHKRKLGSSRRNKGRRRVKSKEEVSEHTKDGEALERTLLSEIQGAGQEDFTQETEPNIIQFVSHDRSLMSLRGHSSDVQSSVPTKYLETDPQNLHLQSENLQQYQEERKPDTNVDESAFLTQREVDQPDTNDSEDDRSGDTLRKMQEATVHPTKMQESPEISESFEIFTNVDSEICQAISGTLTDREMSELTIKNTASTKQEETPLDLTQEYDLHDINKPQINTTEEVGFAGSQVHKFKDRGEDDMNSRSDQRFHQEKEGVFSEVEEGNSALPTSHFDSHFQNNPETIGELPGVLQGYSCETETGEATGNPEIICGTLTDQAEVIIRHQSELTEKSTDHSVTKQGVSTPGEKTIMFSTVEGNLEAVVEKNVSDHVYESEQPRTLNTERAERALSHMYEGGGLMAEDIQHFTGQSVLQEGLFEAEGNNVSIQSPLSHLIHSPSDLQLQDTSTKTHEQTDASLSFSRNRRKLGLSRKNKGKQPVKESKEDIVENTREDEAPERSEVSSEIKTSGQEQLTQDIDIDESETVHGEDTIEAPSDRLEREVMKVGVYPIQMEDHLKTESSAETVTGDATQSCTIISGILRDHVETSQLTVQSTDDSVAEQEACPSKEKTSEASDQKQEDHDLSDTNKQLVIDFDEADSAVGLVHEFKDRVEDDTKPRAEETLRLGKEGLVCEAEENRSTSSTLQSETVTLESESHNKSETVDEQTGFSSGHRRKMGSSRRKKERQQLKESQEDILVNDTVDEALEKTQMSLETGTIILNELKEDTEHEVNLPVSHDSSLFSKFTPGPLEIHSLMPEQHPDTDLKSFIPETVNPPGDPRDRDADIPQSEEVTHLLHSNSAAEGGQEHEDQTTGKQEGLKSDYQSVTSDTSENPEVVPVNLIDRSTITNTHQSEVTEKSPEDSVTSLEESTHVDEQIMFSTGVLEAVVQRDDDDYGNDSKQTWTNKTEEESTSLCQTDEGGGPVEEDKLCDGQSDHQEGVLSEPERRSLSVPPPDPHVQDKSLSTDEKTDASLSFSRNRRKLGLSRKNKGKQPVKESKEDIVENTREDEAPERSEVSSEIKTSGQEQLTQDIDIDESETVHGEDTIEAPSDRLEREVMKVGVYPIQMEDHLKTESSAEIVTGDATQSCTIISGILRDHVETSQLTVQSTDDSAAEQEVCPKENTSEASDQKHEDHDLSDTNKQLVIDFDEADSAVGLVHEFKDRVEDDTKPRAEETLHLGKEGLVCEAEENRSTSSTLQSETVTLESESHNKSETVDEQTGFSSSGHRRKMGSSRRKKERQQFKESQEDILVNDTVDEALEKTQMSLETETIILNELKEDTEHEVNLPVSHDSSLFSKFTPGPLEIHSLMPEQHPDTDLKSFIPETVNPPGDPRDRDADIPQSEEVTHLLHSDGAAEGEQEHEDQTTGKQEGLKSDYQSVTSDTSENPEVVPVNLIDRSTITNTHQSEVTEKSPEDSVTSLEESTHVDGQIMFSTEGVLEAVVQRDDDDYGNDSKQTWTNKTEEESTSLCQTDEGGGPVEEDKLCDGQSDHQEGVLSEPERRSLSVPPPDPHVQDKSLSTDEQTDASLSFSRNRRKLGLSRKNKGKQPVKESKEDIVENTREDEAPERSEVSSEIKTSGQEQLTQDIDIDESETVHGEDTIEAPSDRLEREVMKVGVYPIQMEDHLKTESSAEIVTGDATQSCTIISGILRDHVETSQLTVQSADDSAAEQEACPSKENTSEASDQKHEDHDLSDTNKQLVIDFDEADSAVGLVHEFKDRVEDDTKPRAEETLHLGKEGLVCEAEENRSTSSTLQSETVTLESESHNKSETVDEQTGFSSSGHRRKMGSSRRKKEKQQLKESEEDILVNDTVDEALEKTQMSLETGTIILNELKEDTEHEVNLPVSHDSSLFSKFTPGPLEIHSLMPEQHPDTDLKSFIPETVNPPGDPRDRDADIPQSEEVTHLLHSDGAAEGEQEHEDQTTGKQEGLKSDYQSVTSDTSENPEVVPVNLIDRSTITNTHQSEVTEKSPEDSVTSLEESTHVDEQIMFSTEGVLEAVVQRDDDDYGNDSKQTWTNKTEGESTSLCQTDEGGGPVEEDKLCDGQSDHREGVLSEPERRSLSVPPPDPHVQDKSLSTDEQTDASLSFSRNRRKLGLSRKNKGKQPVKESKEDVVENTREDEAPERSEVSSEIKTSGQEELTQDIDIDVILPVSHDDSLSLIPSAGHSPELQSSVPTNYPETDPQSLIPESENLQEDEDERKSDIIAEMVEESVNITEQEVGDSETVHGEDTIEAPSDRLERDVMKVGVYPIQMEDHLKTESSAETVTGDATQSCTIISGILRDHVETSQLTVQSADDSAAEQEACPSKENTSEASDQKHEDHDLSDTNKQLVIDFDEADSAVGLVHEFRDRVEDDTKPRAEETLHLGKEGLVCEAEENRSTSSTLQSETVTLESESHNKSETVDEQTGFSSSGHRRKMGSSRRKKEKQQLKESEDILPDLQRKVLTVPSPLSDLNTPPDPHVQSTGREDLTEDTEHDVLTVSHESSVSLVLDDSSQIQSFLPTKHHETYPQSPILQSKNRQDDHHERDGTQKEVDKSETLNRDKTRGPSSEVKLREVQDMNVYPTQMPETGYSSETFTGSGTENLNIISGNLTDLPEISELTMESTDEPTSAQEGGHKEENTSEASALKHEDHDLSDTNKQQISDKERESDTCQLREFKGRVEDDTKPNAGQTFPQEKELICETEENKSSSLVVQSEGIPHNDSVTKTGFNNSGHRKKMGSSRRKKERHQVKDSEVLENTSADEAYETKALALEIKTAGLEDLTSDTKHDTILSVSQDSSTSLVPLPGHLSEVQSSVAANAPETDPQNLILKDEIVEESVNLMQQEMEKSEPLQRENTRDVHSDDALMEEEELEVKPKQMHRPGYSPETTNDPTENSEIISKHTQMSELTLESTDDSSVKQEEYPTKENISETLDLKQEGCDLDDPSKPQVRHLEEVDPPLSKDGVEEDVKSNSGQMFSSEKDGLFSEMEENKPALSAFPSESVALDSQPPNKSVREHDQTASCSRRKLGSSRRTKGRPQTRDSATETYNKPIQENEEKGSSDKPHETASAGLEKSIKTVQEEAGQKDSSHNDVEHPHTHTLVWTSDLDTTEVHVASNAGQKVTSKSLSPNEDPPNVIPTTDAVKRDESTECCSVKDPHGQEPEQEELQKDDAVGRDHDRDVLRRLSSDTDSFITSENSSSKDHAEVEYRVVQEAHSSPQDILLMNEEQDNSVNMSTTARTHPSDDIVNNEHKDQIKPEQEPEMHQFHFSSFKLDESSVQALNSDANVALDSHPQDSYQSNRDETHSDLKMAGSRRKLGSSRRLKGRQHAKFTEANQEQQEGDVENTEKDGATQAFAIKTRRHEELQGKSVEKLDTISSTEDDKQPEEDNTFCSHKVLNSSSVSTSDMNPTSNKDGFIESSKDTEQKHITPINKSDRLSPLTENDSNTKDLMQSPQAFVWNRDSDMQSALHHDDVISCKSNGVSVHDQDEVIQHQNAEARTPRGELQLQQANNAREIGAQDPEVGEKCVHEDREVNASPESVSPPEEPALGMSCKNRTSTTMGASNSQDEKTHSDSSENVQEKSKQKKRKLASSRRTYIKKTQEGEAGSRDEAKESGNNTEDDARNPDKMGVVEELLITTEVGQSVNIQPSHGTSGEKTSDAVEEHHGQTPDVKTASPNVNSAFRRRKMGSTRKNLGSQAEREDVRQEEDLAVKATGSEPASGDVRSECEYTDSDQRKEKVCETEGTSRFAGAFLKILAEETPEENPVSPSQLVETEHPHVLPSSSPEKDSESEPAARGRRKKMGSNRRSHQQQRHKDQKEGEDGAPGAQTEVSAGGNAEGGAAEQQRQKSPDLDKIQVEENAEKGSSSISVSESGDLSKPVSEKTADIFHRDDIRLTPDNKRQLSLAGNLGGTESSNRHNVVMIGDSSVGKTSFMKRAQSGKFSLDIPASVGLDSCLWTVVVDGKPVVLQLWDTAGQERFHSLTRQIFHKAQAFLLMYDITSSQSFSAVSYWANSIQEAASANVTVLLLGNKSDQAERRVKAEEGDVLAKEYNFGFMECSAATGENVIEALETVARMLSQRADLREETTALHKQPATKKRSNCC